jgi:hypothetical protein
MLHYYCLVRFQPPYLLTIKLLQGIGKNEKIYIPSEFGHATNIPVTITSWRDILLWDIDMSRERGMLLTRNT